MYDPYQQQLQYQNAPPEYQQMGNQYQQQPNYWQQPSNHQQPNYQQQSNYQHPQPPIFTQSSNFPSQSSSFQQQSPNFSPQRSNFQQHQSNYQQQQPNFQQQQSNYQQPPSNQLHQPPQQPDLSNYQNQSPEITLPKPPEWMRSSCCARFGFGGRLIMFTMPESDQTADWTVFSVYLCQAVTEQTVFEKASQLYTALVGDGSNVNLPFVADLCVQRASQSTDHAEKCVWQFLEAHVRRQTRERYLEIIGSSVDIISLSEKMKTVCDISSLKTEDSDVVFNGSCVNSGEGTVSSDRIQDDEDEVAYHWTIPEPIEPLDLPDDVDSREWLLCELIANGKYAEAVELCIAAGRWMDALQLSMQDRGLYNRTQYRYYGHVQDPISKFISLVVNDKWDFLIASGSLSDPGSWQRLFALLVNHVEAHDLGAVLEKLGGKMEDGETKSAAYASLCYIAAGVVERLVENLSKKSRQEGLSMEEIHDVMEKAMVLLVSLGDGSLCVPKVGPVLAAQLGQYAFMLVGQGCLPLALQLLDALPDETAKYLMDLRYRLYTYLSYSGYLPLNVRRPKAPYEQPRENVHLQQLQAMRRQRTGSIAPPPLQPYGASGCTYSQVHNQPPPQAPASTYGAQMPSGMTAMKASRSRYPSYSSDGISYPSSSAIPQSQASSFAPAVASGPYGQPQYSNYPFYPPSTPQQQWPPPPSPQHPYSDQCGYQQSVFHTMGAANTSHSPSAASIPQPHLPPPPAGPAAQLHHLPWNDPPALSPKKKASSTKRAEPSPVTFPVLGAGSEQLPGQFNQQVPYSPGQRQQQRSPSPVPAPAIPVQHERVMSVLIRLGELTAARAQNVQMKRRIEENLHKLKANLPTLLACGKLSQSTLRELHQVIDHIQLFDYNSAIALHANIVEGNDFATISSFMPSVKTIIQFAAQMGVYYS